MRLKKKGPHALLRGRKKKDLLAAKEKPNRLSIFSLFFAGIVLAEDASRSIQRIQYAQNL